ncbi:unnamed protein product [Rhodiola kirilowii]
MASAAVHSPASAVGFRKENGMIPSSWFSVRSTQRELTPKIFSVMAPQQEQRSPERFELDALFYIL